MSDARALIHRDGDGTLALRVSGDWSLSGTTPLPAQAMKEVADDPPERVVFQAAELGRWDSSLVSFLAFVSEASRAQALPVDTSGLPRGLQHLLALAAGPRRPIPPPRPHQPLPTRVGVAAIDFGSHAAGLLDLVGRASLAVKEVLVGRGHFDRRDPSGIHAAPPPPVRSPRCPTRGP